MIQQETRSRITWSCGSNEGLDLLRPIRLLNWQAVKRGIRPVSDTKAMTRLPYRTARWASARVPSVPCRITIASEVRAFIYVIPALKEKAVRATLVKVGVNRYLHVLVR